MHKDRRSVMPILRMIISYEPFYVPISIIKMIVQSFSVWLGVWFPKQFIEMLTQEVPVYSHIEQKIVIFALLMIILWILNVAITAHIDKVTERFVQKMRKEIGMVSMEQPFWIIESGSYREKLNMANNIVNILNGVNILGNIIEGMIISVGLALLLIKYNIQICLLIFIVIGTKIIFVKFTVNYTNKRRFLYSKNDKIGNYLTNTAYMNAGAAKEIRINNISNWFMTKVKAYRNEMLSYQYKDFMVYALFDILGNILMAGQTTIVLLSLTWQVANNTISIADFTMYFAAITTITVTLSGIITKFGDYTQYKIGFGDFSSLYTSMNKKMDVINRDVEFGEIYFDHVSFKYPNTEKYVLQNIDVHISKGEKLSIVGLNGAGKSTFVKLLCKFYKPSEGKILINGIDIWDIDDSSYYKMISAVFQDYVNFDFSIKENITIGNQIESPEKVAKKIGFYDSFINLYNGYDTIISRLFNENGVDLSGGEHQKVAILRALYKDAPLTILDEPTKALDAKTEAEMYEAFFKLMEGRTSIFISHRLASAVVADKILVLDKGHINDYGTHSQLMKKGGLYSEMYRKQSEVYCD